MARPAGAEGGMIMKRLHYYIFAVRWLWRQIATAAHPDSGGNAEFFQVVKDAYEQALQLVEG